MDRGHERKTGDAENGARRRVESVIELGLPMVALGARSGTFGSRGEMCHAAVAAREGCEFECRRSKSEPYVELVPKVGKG